MAVTVACPSCGTTFNLSDELAGKKVRCRECQALFRAEAITTATPEEEEPLDVILAEKRPAESARGVRPDRDEPVRASPRDRRRPRERSPAPTVMGSLAVWVIAGLGFFGLIVVALAGAVAFSTRNAEPSPPRAAVNPPPLAPLAPLALPPREQPRGNDPRTRPENEQADAIGALPPATDVALSQAGAKVYLCDLKEFAWKAGAGGWSFGKNGELGSVWSKVGILVDGKKATKGLSMHPPDAGYTRVCYPLNQRVQRVQGTVTISEDEPRTSPNPTRFVILGDGQVLWRSESIRAFKDRQVFDVDVASVRVLELRVYVEGTSALGSHAAWIDPVVLVKE